MSEEKHPFLISAFRLFIFTGFIVFFIIFIGKLDYSRLNDLQFSVLPLVISAALSLLYRLWGVYVWRGILLDLGSTRIPDFNELTSVYAQAWMARYIPGSVTSIAAKVLLANDFGISNSRLAVASLVEAGIQIVAIATTSILLVSMDNRVNELIPNDFKWTVVLCIIFLLIMLMPPVFNFLQQAGKISDHEMQRTFNNGIGIVAIVPPDATADVLQRLQAMNEQAFLIGEILDCKDSSQRIIWE